MLGVGGDVNEIGRPQVELGEDRRRFIDDAERSADCDGESVGDGYAGVGSERRSPVDDEHGETGEGGYRYEAGAYGRVGALSERRREGAVGEKAGLGARCGWRCAVGWRYGALAWNGYAPSIECARGGIGGAAPYESSRATTGENVEDG